MRQKSELLNLFLQTHIKYVIKQAMIMNGVPLAVERIKGIRPAPTREQLDKFSQTAPDHVFGELNETIEHHHQQCPPLPIISAPRLTKTVKAAINLREILSQL